MCPYSPLPPPSPIPPGWQTKFQPPLPPDWISKLLLEGAEGIYSYTYYIVRTVHCTVYTRINIRKRVAAPLSVSHIILTFRFKQKIIFLNYFFFSVVQPNYYFTSNCAFFLSRGSGQHYNFLYCLIMILCNTSIFI